MIALFIDPLYFFLPVIGGPACMNIDFGLGILVTFFRTIADMFYWMHIALKFRTAYIAKNTRVFGRGQLVMDKRLIAMRYLKSDFVIDLGAALPLPQFVIWFVIPAVKSPTASHANHTVALIVLVQYVPRLFLIFPLNRRIIKTTGVIAKTAWTGAAYNMLLYMLASHVLGASWYLLSIERQYSCWTQECRKEENFTDTQPCQPLFLDCSSVEKDERQAWMNFTRVLANCDARNDSIKFQFGIFADAFTDEVASANIIEKYFYCLWWGLKTLVSYGQDLMTSTFTGEITLCIVICVVGLVLFAHLIGNIQSFLQSTTVRLEQWRIKGKDTEEWMRHRQLPPELQERVRRFVHFKWLATRGVDEEAILRSLPLDLRREIQRHLCLALVRRVPFFSQMDDQLLDAICERLVSSLSTNNQYIIREGDPVNAMLFIIRGELESSTTNGGRSGFYNSITLKAGDFCGEELLTWALMPTSSLHLPTSTRTVKTVTEVEAFALRADDLKFVANQFRRLHSKKLQHAFRYYSHQWRTWGACFIQAAWRRYKKKRLAEELARQESLSSYYNMYRDEYEDSGVESSSSLLDDNRNSLQNLGTTILASKFAANTRRGIKVKGVEPDSASLKMPKLFKPNEPDFSADPAED